MAARRVYQRILLSGINVEYDDIFQESSIVWLTCQKKFDETLGFQFSTYFMRAVWLTVFRDYQKKNVRFQAFHLNTLDNDLAEIKYDILDDSPNIESVLCSVGVMKAIAAKLSPFARRFLEILIDPPEIVLDNFKGLSELAEYGRSIGHSRRSPKELNINTLCRILRINREKRETLTREFKEVLNEFID